MSYKVLNMDWDKIIVDEINPDIHLHLSWRRFTDEDWFCKKEEKTLIEKTKEVIKEVNEINMEEAREQYKEKYNRYPSSKMKLENIIAKLW